MRCLGAIIAGGKSSRMGQEKAFLPLGKDQVIGHVIKRLKPQVTTVIINANGDAKRFSAYPYPLIADRLGTIASPLSGIYAALHYAAAENFTHLLTVPCDTPYLPMDLCARLQTAGKPAVAASGLHIHYICGLWPIALLAALRSVVYANKPIAMHAWVKDCKAQIIKWPQTTQDPFMNLNQPSDWEEACAIAGKTLS